MKSVLLTLEVVYFQEYFYINDPSSDHLKCKSGNVILDSERNAWKTKIMWKYIKDVHDTFLFEFIEFIEFIVDLHWVIG